MKYFDMHCDTLTVCADRGLDLNCCDLQTDLTKLKNSGCAAQCFAVFTQDAAPSDFERYAGFLKGSGAFLIDSSSDLLSCLQGERCGAVLTVENLGFIGRDIGYLVRLKEAGVKMASLVWNYENNLAYPNLCLNGSDDLRRRETRGLKPYGRRVAEALDELKIIIDISHLSDGGAEELLGNRKIPLVASHSNAQGVHNVSRNLPDVLIKKIADCGGVVGVNFCADFLGKTDEDTFCAVYSHIKRIIGAGGEDVVAFGSDFDGIPPCKDLEDCSRMPRLIEYLSERFPPRIIRKLCYSNFYRVFREVCG